METRFVEHFRAATLLADNAAFFPVPGGPEGVYRVVPRLRDAADGPDAGLVFVDWEAARALDALREDPARTRVAAGGTVFEFEGASVRLSAAGASGGIRIGRGALEAFAEWSAGLPRALAA